MKVDIVVEKPWCERMRARMEKMAFAVLMAKPTHVLAAPIIMHIQKDYGFTDEFGVQQITIANIHQVTLNEEGSSINMNVCVELLEKSNLKHEKSIPTVLSLTKQEFESLLDDIEMIIQNYNLLDDLWDVI